MTTAAPPRWTGDSRWVLFPQPAEGGWQLSWLARNPRDGMGSVLTESESHADGRGSTVVRLRTPGVNAEWRLRVARGGVCAEVVEQTGAKRRLPPPAVVLAGGIVDGPCGNPNYDVSPDGSRMVAVYRDVVSRPSSLRFVLNFAAELR